MNKPTIYLETSFINRLADPLKADPRTRLQQLASREWWQVHRHRFTLITSEFTINESCRDYPNKRLVRLRERRLATVTIVRPPAAPRRRLAEALCRPGGPLPPTELLDAQHIACAAIAGCEYLLTWNQKHIANPVTRRTVDNIIEAHGYEPAIVATPEALLEAAPE